MQLPTFISPQEETRPPSKQKRYAFSPSNAATTTHRITAMNNVIVLASMNDAAFQVQKHNGIRSFSDWSFEEDYACRFKVQEAQDESYASM